MNILPCRSHMPRVLSLLVLVSGLSAQVSEHRSRLGVPQDWTHRHVVFGHKLVAEHPEVAVVEPRLLHEVYRRTPVSLPSGTAPLVSDEQLAEMSAPGPKRDWNLFLGNGWVRIGMSPAKYSFDVNAPPSCANDYVVFGLAVSGVTGGQGNLVAVNNLYRGTGGLCGSLAAPTTFFSYNTTTVAGSEIRTSPVLSLDGTKIAFVESAAASSTFHVLRWATGAGNGTSPTVSATPGAGNTAVMTSLTYAAARNTRSSPWIDYTNDVAYVGADDGNLYKITGVFNGTPTLAGAPWPVLIGANRILTSPVLDQVTKNLFLGDNTGRLWSVNSVTPATKKQLAVGLANGANPAVFDGPILDAGKGTVFAVSSSDGTSAVLVQAGTTNLNELARARIGRGSGGGVSVNLYDGAFDDNYFKGLPTGFLFVCGTGAADSTPWRYSFQFTAGVLNTLPSDSGQILNVAGARCSPISEFFNKNIGAGGTDFFFWGLTTNCPVLNALGCVISRTSPGGVVTMVGEPGGTSTVTVDNVSTLGQASSIYFTDLGMGRRAVKLTQNGLQ